MELITRILTIIASDIVVDVLISFVASFIRTLLIYPATKFIIKKLRTNKIVNIIGFIFLYLFPLTSIVYIFTDNSLTLDARNVLSLIILCLCIVYNLLMSHIITIYDMISQKTNIDSEKLKEIDDTFMKVYTHIESIRENKG